MPSPVLNLRNLISLLVLLREQHHEHCIQDTLHNYFCIRCEVNHTLSNLTSVYPIQSEQCNLTYMILDYEMLTSCIVPYSQQH